MRGRLRRGLRLVGSLAVVLLGLLGLLRLLRLLLLLVGVLLLCIAGHPDFYVGHVGKELPDILIDALSLLSLSSLCSLTSQQTRHNTPDIGRYKCIISLWWLLSLLLLRRRRRLHIFCWWRWWLSPGDEMDAET